MNPSENAFVGRRVRVRFHNIVGTVTRWEPLGASMNDILVRDDTGHECWHASHGAEPIDGLGPLPSRRTEREQADRRALESLRAIRAQLVTDWARPWPGVEHGKALVGRAIDAAIAEVERKR